MKTTIKEIFREIMPLDSFANARRNIHIHNVRFNGELVASLDQEVNVEDGSIFQLGKRQTFQRDGMKWIRKST